MRQTISSILFGLSKSLRGLTALVAIILATTAYEAKAQFKFGGQVGTNYSFSSPQIESEGRLGTMFGGIVEYRFKSSPWLLRAELNWEHNTMLLKNFDMKSMTGSALEYDLSLRTINVPISVGYRFHLTPSLTLTPRAGMWRREGLNNSSGVVTSYALNQGESTQPNSLGIMLFEGASGKVTKNSRNYFGTYSYNPFNRVQYGLLLGLDLSLGRHWQASLNYQHGTGTALQYETTSEANLYLRAFEFSLAYIL